MSTDTRLDAAAAKWGWSPEFLALCKQMGAEARAKRERGEIMPYRGLSEGRNDLQNYKLGQEWTR